MLWYYSPGYYSPASHPGVGKPRMRLVGRSPAQVDHVSDHHARRVKGQEGPERGYSRLRGEKRLAEREVDEHPTECSNRTGNADHRPGEPPGLHHCSFPGFTGFDLHPGPAREDRRDHLV